MQGGFGMALKEWRRLRRMSQLDLGLVANVSARHIAFLETGRARPSRSMVLQLSEGLEVPRQGRNALMHAAGFAPIYRALSLDDASLSAVRGAIDWMLQHHLPYPAYALDRHWHIVAANRAAEQLFSSLGLGAGGSLLTALAAEQPLRQAIVNWPEVARFLALRLRTESRHLGGDAVLDAAANTLLANLAPGPAETGPMQAFIATRLRLGGADLALLSTVAQFGTAEDIALADLRLELMFPADEATRRVLEAGAA